MLFGADVGLVQNSMMMFVNHFKHLNMTFFLLILRLCTHAFLSAEVSGLLNSCVWQYGVSISVMYLASFFFVWFGLFSAIHFAAVTKLVSSSLV